MKREGPWLYVDDVPPLQFTLLWVPPEFPRGDPRGLQQQHSCRGRGRGEGRAALWRRQTWSICLFFLASFLSFMLILTISCPVDLNCSVPFGRRHILDISCRIFSDDFKFRALQFLLFFVGYCGIFVKLRYTAVPCSKWQKRSPVDQLMVCSVYALKLTSETNATR